MRKVPSPRVLVLALAPVVTALACGTPTPRNDTEGEGQQDAAQSEGKNDAAAGSGGRSGNGGNAGSSAGSGGSAGSAAGSGGSNAGSGGNAAGASGAGGAAGAKDAGATDASSSGGMDAKANTDTAAAAVTFTSLYNDIFGVAANHPSSCQGSGCHNPGKSHNIDVSSKDKAFMTLEPFVKNGELVKVLDSGAMPEGRTKVSDALRTKLKTWIAAGAKND